MNKSEILAQSDFFPSLLRQPAMIGVIIGYQGGPWEILLGHAYRSFFDFSLFFRFLHPVRPEYLPMLKTQRCELSEKIKGNLLNDF